MIRDEHDGPAPLRRTAAEGGAIPLSDRRSLGAPVIFLASSICIEAMDVAAGASAPAAEPVATSPGESDGVKWRNRRV